MDDLQNHINNIIKSDEIHITVEGETIRKTTIAQQMAEQGYDKNKVNMENSIPEKYQRHKKVFSEQEAAQFPPPRPWDHKIKLTKDAPDVINGKIYPLPRE